MRFDRVLKASPVLVLLATLAAPLNVAHAEPARFATDVELREESGTTSLTLKTTAKPTYTARLERDGMRLVIDLTDCSLKGAPPAITRRTGLVAGVMLQEFADAGRPVSRILVTLAEKAEHSIVVNEDGLSVKLRPVTLGGPRKATRPEAAAVQDLRFSHAAGRDTVTVAFVGEPRYRQTTGKPGRTRLVLDGARLPEALTRTLDVAAFGGPVSHVSSFPSSARPGDIVIEVEHSPSSRARVERRGNTLVWTFAEPGAEPWSESGVGPDGGPARRARTVGVESEPEDLPRVEAGFTAHVKEAAAAPDAAQGFGPGLFGQQRANAAAQRYTGRRIDLDLKDADVHNVLRLLADVGRVNIVTADNVSGAVTIRMRNVPWDQALDVILQSKNLGMVRQGNMIRVAPLADLEKERELEIARRKQEMKLAPLETRLIPVSYAEAVELQARARDLLSDRGSIAVDERTNVLITRDVAGNLNQVEELVRSLDTQTPQVLVEARIVEATSRYLRDVGIQWGGDASFSAATGNPTGLAFPNSLGVVGGASDTTTPTAGLSPFSNAVANPNFAVNLPATVGTGQGGALGLSFGSVDNTVNLNVRLSAAEATGMLRILSSPRILTLDNMEARISQGTLIPFSQISAQGVQTTFQEAKLQLRVRPHVTADGSVSMKVKINRDEPDFNQTSARGDPTILKREAETTLLVADGHTAVIGGIYTRNTGRNLDQVPFFGDIPLIGLLFQRRRASDSRGELVIFLTPRIVNRAEALGR
jgi:type IV pilus assembly protein PilQ